MRVHHLNCGTLHPPSARLVNGAGGLLRPATLVCHCLLIDTGQGLVLVDTGIGTAAIDDPEAALGRRFLRLNRPVLDPSETALHRVEALGYAARDVADVVLTHLDRDHAGGLADFPAARIHLATAELDSARARATTREQSRYLPTLWEHRPRWTPHTIDRPASWFGLDATGPLPGIDVDIRLIALPGHTAGHTGVAVALADERWLLHAGDAYFHHREVAPRPRSTPGLALFQRLVQHHGPTRGDTQDRLGELAARHRDRVTVFSSHDPGEYGRLHTNGTA